MLLSGVAELVSLGSVLPFLVVLIDPEKIWQIWLVRSLATRLGFTAASQLLLPSMLVFLAATLLGALIRLANLWLNGLLAAVVGSDLSCEAYRRTLLQPYGVHLQRNSSETITCIISEVNQTVIALNSLLQLISSAVVAAGMLAALLLVNTSVALSTLALFAIAYGALAIVSQSELRSNSYKIAEATSQQLKALQEGLGAIRDVLIDGIQPVYLRIYERADRPSRKLIAKNLFLGAFPRFVLEPLGIVAIASLGAILVLERGSGVSVIPLLGALALGAQRLLPALQQVYNSWAALKGSNAAIQHVLALLSQPLPPEMGEVAPLQLRNGIRFEGVHFSYGPGQPDVLQGLDLEIRRGERIGFIGSTGSGKSTTVDLLMGLLKPTGGRLLVNGEDLNNISHPERLLSWQATIAHVPQNIYLADSTVAENIAFGLDRHKIDLQRVRRAAEQAQISSFIEGCPEGYETFVGERGIRLSGGQRQRIGIARALYKRASVLILDEATSALDSRTEEAVMAAVEGLGQELTIVMIAHRLSTVQCCDRIICLENGGVLSQGSPGDVIAFLTK